VKVSPSKFSPSIDAAVDSEREPAHDDVLTVAEAAHLLRVSRNAIYDAVNAGKLPHLRIGKHIRLSRAELVRSLGSCGRSLGALKGH